MFPGYQSKAQRLVRDEKNRAELSELKARLDLGKVEQNLQQEVESLDKRLESLEATVAELKAGYQAAVDAQYGKFKPIRKRV